LLRLSRAFEIRLVFAADFLERRVLADRNPWPRRLMFAEELWLLRIEAAEMKEG